MEINIKGYKSGINWKSVKAVIFDMDGVLTDSEPLINEAAILALNEYSIKASKRDFDPFIGAGDLRYIAGVAEKYGIKFRQEMKERMYEIYFRLLPEKLKPLPGVNEFINSLKSAGMITAIASAADRIKVEANLNAIKLPLGLIDIIVTGNDISHTKPDPEIFTKTAEKLKISPEFCCVIEDALNGIEAAKRAGMKCIAVTTSFQPGELSTKHPDSIFDNLVEINNDFNSFAIEKLHQ